MLHDQKQVESIETQEDLLEGEEEEDPHERAAGKSEELRKPFNSRASAGNSGRDALLGEPDSRRDIEDFIMNDHEDESGKHDAAERRDRNTQKNQKKGNDRRINY